jgi:DTW domain-containing protein YfiP
VGKFFAGNAEVERLIRDPENQCVILYPGSESTLLEGGKPIEKPGRRLVIFLIDGTWTTAKNMLRLSPNLQALPQIRLNPVRKSQYRIRRQPQSVCLSTVEATHQLIEAVDGPGECENLLHVFRYMVDEQLKWSTPRWNLEPDLALKPVSAVVPESVGQECTK